ncbi:MAG: transposase, partial [Neisseriaceae bacterium]|nr:transposase [Neisseriaceae bacterium]
MKAYKYRLYPTKEQQEFFAKTFGCVRKVYNLMLAERIENHKQGIKARLPTPAKYKTEFEYLKEVDSLALANAQLNLDKAYKNFFRRVQQGKKVTELGFPKFKSKHNPIQSYTTNNQKGSISVIGSKLIKLPKLREGVKIKIHRQFEGLIKSATISKTSSNKYYISILVDEGHLAVVPTTIISEETLGIDLGIDHYLIDSLGRKVSNPKYLDHSLVSLKKKQRILSRKKKGSNNRNKQKILVAKQHEVVANQRNDFLQKLSTKLAYDNQITSFAIEDLNVKGMTKNHHLAKKINDCAWSKFISYLEYKCKELGKNIIKIDRFAPSSKVCSCCGHKLEKLSLSTRKWQCPQCDSLHDRDVNAAKNIRAIALANIAGTAMCVKSSL